MYTFYYTRVSNRSRFVTNYETENINFMLSDNFKFNKRSQKKKGKKEKKEKQDKT